MLSGGRVDEVGKIGPIGSLCDKNATNSQPSGAGLGDFGSSPFRVFSRLPTNIEYRSPEHNTPAEFVRQIVDAYACESQG